MDLVKSLRHLHRVKCSDLSRLPKKVPHGFGTIQVYSAVFDALLAGHRFLRFHDDRLEVRENENGPPKSVTQVPNGGKSACGLAQELLMKDQLFRDLFEPRPMAAFGPMDLVLAEPQGISWDELKAIDAEGDRLLIEARDKGRLTSPSALFEIERELIKQVEARLKS